MKVIQELIDRIDDEICSAKDYSEMYLQLKAEGKDEFASEFRQMATQEIDHAMILHEYAVKKVEKLKEVYQAPSEMQEKWDKSHKKYVERIAFIKQMLTM